MSNTAVWQTFETALSSHPNETLAAYLGDKTSQTTLDDLGLRWPTTAVFEADKDYDPNPFNLSFPTDYLQTARLIKSLSLWGPIPLIQAAFACSTLQQKLQTARNTDAAIASQIAHASCVSYINSKSNLGAVCEAAEKCRSIYLSFESEPDSTQAEETWHSLGAAWFAAETIIQDYSLQQYDGPGPREASSTWCNRNTVWPQRAAEAAAKCSSDEDTRNAIRTRVIQWANGS